MWQVWVCVCVFCGKVCVRRCGGVLRAPGSRAPALPNGAPRKKRENNKKTLSTCGANKACGTEESRLQAKIRGGSPRACADAPSLKRVGSPRDRCVRPQSLAPTASDRPEPAVMIC